MSQHWSDAFDPTQLGISNDGDLWLLDSDRLTDLFWAIGGVKSKYTIHTYYIEGIIKTKDDKVGIVLGWPDNTKKYFFNGHPPVLKEKRPYYFGSFEKWENKGFPFGHFYVMNGSKVIEFEKAKLTFDDMNYDAVISIHTVVKDPLFLRIEGDDIVSAENHTFCLYLKDGYTISPDLVGENIEKIQLVSIDLINTPKGDLAYPEFDGYLSSGTAIYTDPIYRAPIQIGSFDVVTNRFEHVDGKYYPVESEEERFQQINIDDWYLHSDDELIIDDKILSVKLKPNSDIARLSLVIVKLYQEKEIEYPYRRIVDTFPSFDDIRDFKSDYIARYEEWLVGDEEFNWDMTKKTKKPYKRVINPKLEDVRVPELDKLVDDYTERRRLGNNVDALLDPAVVRKILMSGKVLSPLDIRNQLEIIVPETPYFGICLTKTILDAHCKNGVFLDLNFGMGDRFLGALCSNIKLHIAFNTRNIVEDMIKEGWNKDVGIETYSAPFSVRPVTGHDRNDNPIKRKPIEDVNLVFTSPIELIPSHLNKKGYEEWKAKKYNEGEYKKWLKQPYIEEKEEEYRWWKRDEYEKWRDETYYPLLDSVMKIIKNYGNLIFYLKESEAYPTLIKDTINRIKARFRRIPLGPNEGIYIWTKVLPKN
jgi:hypothetical protein